MTEPTAPPDLLTAPPARWRRWVGVLVGPIAWFVRLVVGWLLSEFACGHRSLLDSWLGPLTGLAVITWAITLVFVAATAWSGVVSWRLWKRETKNSDDRVDPIGATAFLGLTGVISAILFILLMLLEASPSFVSRCG